MNSEGRIYYYFGSFQLDVGARLLLRDGEVVPLTPKIFETLLLLLQSNGKIVEREQLIHTVWHDSYIEEGNISSTIYLLRKALGDNHNGQSFIATVPRRGYRFIVPVREVCVADQKNMASTTGVLAVLPFRSLHNTEPDNGLGLGLTDALITQLSNCQKLTVRPTNIIRKYTDIDIDYVLVGEELGVELIVEGNFQHTGEYIRVTAQLISVRNAVSLWAATYDEQFTNIFRVEDSISKNIANDLLLELIEKNIKDFHYHPAHSSLVQTAVPAVLNGSWSQ
ncbi:MAG: winged helix-turn-helix domain-containing protein [Acidobacteria bacterium]|nr:winged helix-turn-helix domain-containing protein [Acidobacteriota bacterium]